MSDQTKKQEDPMTLLNSLMGKSSALKTYIQKRLAANKPQANSKIQTNTPTYLLEGAGLSDTKKCRITKLTQAQKDALKSYQTDWLAVGLSTEPADKTAAVQGIHAAYKYIGLNMPEIYWEPSAFAGLSRAIKSSDPSIESAIRSKTLETARDIVKKEVAPQVISEIRTELLDFIGERLAEIQPMVGVDLVNILSVDSNDFESTRKDSGSLPKKAEENQAATEDPQQKQVEYIQDKITSACYGQYDAAWLCFYEYCWKVLGIHKLECLSGQIQIARSASWWWPLESSVVITERPVILSLDKNNKLHSSTNNAIEYADGYGTCVWHGVRVPQEAILSTLSECWAEVEAIDDPEIKDALVDIKALKWADGDEHSEKFEAAMAAKRLGGVTALKALVED